MAESNNSSKLLKQMIIRWYIQKSKSSKNISLVGQKTTVKLPIWIKKRRRIAFIEAVLATLCRPRNRLLWNHPRSYG